MTITVLLGILTYLGTMLSGHFKDNHATRDRLLQDAEKQCFEVEASQKNCSVLNYTIQTNLVKGQPLPDDLTRQLRDLHPLHPATSSNPVVEPVHVNPDISAEDLINGTEAGH